MRIIMEVKKVSYTKNDLEKYKDCALVIQGGSMRCQFTAGVLDYFMKQSLWFPYVIGVSSGSLSAINYISGQIGRTAKINIDYANDHRYVSPKNFLREKSIVSFDFLFGELSDTLIPLDREAFCNSPIKYTAVATGYTTGKPVYFSNDSCSDVLLAARASASLPLISKTVTVDGIECVDGGVSEPVSYKKPFEDGYKKTVIILTREKGYRKSPNRLPMLAAYHAAYRDNPKLLLALEQVPALYNAAMDEIEQLEAEGKVFVIRPLQPVTVKRLEKDTKKLKALYKEGRKTAAAMYDELIKYLNG